MEVEKNIPATGKQVLKPEVHVCLVFLRIAK